MSRRGNCHDNAVAENFFSLLKRASQRFYKSLASQWNAFAEKPIAHEMRQG